jgi:hypothetical protein
MKTCKDNYILGGRSQKPKTPKRKSRNQLSPLSPYSPHSYHSANINPNVFLPSAPEHTIALARREEQFRRRGERRNTRRAIRRDTRRNARIPHLSRGISPRNLYPTYEREPDPRGHLSIAQRLIRKLRGYEY